MLEIRLCIGNNLICKRCVLLFPTPITLLRVILVYSMTLLYYRCHRELLREIQQTLLTQNNESWISIYWTSTIDCKCSVYVSKSRTRVQRQRQKVKRCVIKTKTKTNVYLRMHVKYLNAFVSMIIILLPLSIKSIIAILSLHSIVFSIAYFTTKQKNELLRNFNQGPRIGLTVNI